MRVDRRVKRTRQALAEAFNQLVLDRRKRHFRVADIVEQAKVGRSTFYDHYSSAEELHMEALRRPFGPLADAAAGQGDEAAVGHILSHFWEYRSRAGSHFGDRTQRLLAEMVEERLTNEPLLLPNRLVARQLAAAALGPLIAWLSGEGPATVESLARALCRAGRAQLQALRP